MGASPVDRSRIWPMPLWARVGRVEWRKGFRQRSNSVPLDVALRRLKRSTVVVSGDPESSTLFGAGRQEAAQVEITGDGTLRR